MKVELHHIIKMISKSNSVLKHIIANLTIVEYSYVSTQTSLHMELQIKVCVYLLKFDSLQFLLGLFTQYL